MTEREGWATEPGPAVGWGLRDALAVVVVAHLVLVIGGSAAISIGGWTDPFPVSANFAAGLPFWAAALGGSWWLSGRDGGDRRAALGLTIRPIDVPLGVVVGVAMQLLVLPVIYWPLLRLIDSDTREVERLARELADSAQGPAGVVMFVVMTCVAAPLVEEVLYRGILQRGAGRDRAVVGVVVAAVVFGCAHLQALQLLGLVAFGLSSGLLVWRTGRLGPGIVAHVAFNAATVVPLLWHRI